MSNVIYRSVMTTPPIVAQTSSYHLNVNGLPVLDMASGACAANLGYSNSWIITNMRRQLDVCPWVFSGSFGNPAAEQAADVLCQQFEALKPGWFGGVIFQTTGSEAVDLACKLAAQYHAEDDKSKRTRMMVQRHAFHGVTLLPSALSAHYPRYSLVDDYQGPACVLYTDNIGRTFFELDKNLDHTHAALLVEPVSGPQMGIRPQAPSELEDLIERCHEDDVLVIYDEVLCGSGRCGYLTNAALQEQHWPDIIILGKGISGGYAPVSPIIISKKVRDRIARGSGQLMFGTTYSAHPMGCAAVKATLDYIDSYHVYHRVRDNGPRVRDMLQRHWPGPISWRGYLFGISLPRLVPDLHLKAREECLKRGVHVYSKGGTVNGKGNYITIAPALDMPDALIERGTQLIGEALKEVMNHADYHNDDD